MTRIAGLVLLAGWALLVYPHARVALIYGRPWSWLAAALGTALALSVVGPLRRVLCAAIERPPRWAFLGVSAAICAGISAATLLLVLDGKPMSRDAAVYLMEARALASGTLGIEVPAPALGASAHFLLACKRPDLLFGDRASSQGRSRFLRDLSQLLPSHRACG